MERWVNTLRKYGRDVVWGCVIMLVCVREGRGRRRRRRRSPRGPRGAQANPGEPKRAHEVEEGCGGAVCDASQHTHIDSHRVRIGVFVERVQGRKLKSTPQHTQLPHTQAGRQEKQRLALFSFS